MTANYVINVIKSKQISSNSLVDSSHRPLIEGTGNSEGFWLDGKFVAWRVPSIEGDDCVGRGLNPLFLYRIC
jgi:hypothetical protein